MKKKKHIDIEKATLLLILIYPLFVILDMIFTYIGFFHFNLIETNNELFFLWFRYGYWLGSLLNFIPLLSFLFISYCFIEKMIRRNSAHNILLLLFFLALVYISLLSFFAVVNNIILIITA